MNNIFTSKKIKEFNDQGYLKISENSIFDQNEIIDLIKVFDELIPNYKDGEIIPFDKKYRYFNPDYHQEFDSRIKTHFVRNNIGFYGCARRHSYLRGNGSALRELDDNIFFGKRAVLIDRFFPQKIVNFVESKKIIRSLSELYSEDKLSFHNGSLAAVFPGCLGEPKQFHIDTPGFNKPSTNLLSKEKFLINVFVFLTDITDKNAPMRIIPESHKHYRKINDYLSTSFKKSNKINNIPQASGNLWEELLPENLQKPINLVGKKGTVIFMRSDILHASTENYSKSTRKVMILNYSKRSDDEFCKKIYHDPKNCRKLYSLFSDKSLVKKTFYGSGHPPIKYYLSNFKRDAINFVRKNWRTPFRPLKKLFLIIFNKTNKEINDKEYLNIGSGTFWRDENVVGLDYDPDYAEVSVNLNNKSKLPFKDSRFKGIYSSHCLEHLKEDTVAWWLKESYRTLKANGVLRVTVPDIKAYLDAYDAKDASYFDWIRGSSTYTFDSWLRLIVRAFAEPVVDDFSDQELEDLYHKFNHKQFLDFFSKKVKLVTDDRFLIPGCHKSWWSAEKMGEFMKKAGFRKGLIKSRRDSESQIFRGNKFNNTRPNMSFYIEAIK